MNAWLREPARAFLGGGTEALLQDTESAVVNVNTTEVSPLKRMIVGH